MWAHLAAIAALAPAGVHVYDTEAERPDYDPTDWLGAWSAAERAAWVLPDRYVVLSSPSLRRDTDTMSRAVLDIDDYVQVKAVALTARECRHLQGQLQDALDRAHPVVAGFSTDLFLGATGITAVDRDVTPHRVHSADSYRYRATPI